MGHKQLGRHVAKCPGRDHRHQLVPHAVHRLLAGLFHEWHHGRRGRGHGPLSLRQRDARSILVFDENGSWELLERPGGDGDPTTVDSGTVELAPDGSEEMYLAVSSQFDDVGYEFTILDHDTLRWGSEFEFYQKMA